MPDHTSIIRLEPGREDTARALWSLFQRSSKEEAQLIGSETVPSLDRTVEDFRQSRREFFGVVANGAILAAAEIDSTDEIVSITGLVVDPAVFQHGYASRLLERVFAESGCRQALGETSERNLPALLLSAKFDCYELERYTTEAGFEMIRLGVDLH